MSLVLAVLLAGCTSGPSQSEVPVKETVDTTQQSISQAGTIDSDLNDQETQNISSDLDKVIDTLG